jgi:hypothetical protein
MPEAPSPSAPETSARAQPAAAASTGHEKQSLFVAHSLVLAVQDAADHVRFTATIANTAIGVALQRFLATGDEQHLRAIAPAQRSITDATHSLGTIAAQAASALRAAHSPSTAKTAARRTP